MSREPGAGMATGPEPGAATVPLLEVRGLGKRFGALRALDDVSLVLEAGEVHCLLGENGAGKSTLCNLVFGTQAPDSGSMRLRGEDYRPTGPVDALTRGIAMVHQHFSLVPDVTVVDNLLLGQARGLLRRDDCATRIRVLADRYGMPLDPFARVSDLAVGERQRVEIVKCLMREPSLLVLDEPTAVLLPQEIRALLATCERVAAQGCGVVLVTHKLAEIRRVADRVTVLRSGRVVARSDRPDAEMNDLVRAMILRSPDATQTSVVPCESAPDKDPVAMQKRSSLQRPDSLMVDGLRVQDTQGVTRVDNFTIIVRPGEIVGVAGVEGNGQVELAAALSGLAPTSGGRFFVGGVELTGAPSKAVTAAGAGIIPEDRHASGCVAAMSVAHNLMLGRLARYRRYGLLLDRQAIDRDAGALMRTYDVRATGPGATFGRLSGGNQQKAVLARELTTEGLCFLLAAQPTRGLDVGAVEAVYGHIEAACARGVGVLLISSELDDLLRVADRIVVMYRGRIMGECRADAGQRDRIGAWMAGKSA